MATRSSILAWKIPWTEEPGRLQSIGLQRVGHGWAILMCVCIYIYVLIYLCTYIYYLERYKSLYKVPSCTFQHKCSLIYSICFTKVLIDVALRRRFQEAMPLFVTVNNSLTHSSAKRGTYMVQTGWWVLKQGIWRVDGICTDRDLARALSKWRVKKIQELESMVKVDTRRISEEGG